MGSHAKDNKDKPVKPQGRTSVEALSYGNKPCDNCKGKKCAACNMTGYTNPKLG